jgi:DNA-binding transcriptional LysR family regulator
MPSYDPEIQHLRKGVHCATLLEHQSPPWKIDRKESTKHCLKYRRGSGEILILNHEGRGWWDPQSDAKGDVFDLVQHFEPSLNFGQVRKVLREFIGLAPAFPETLRRRKKNLPDSPPADRWATQPKCTPRSHAWTYLTQHRELPFRVLAPASAADVLREGPYGSGRFTVLSDTPIAAAIRGWVISLSRSNTIWMR